MTDFDVFHPDRMASRILDMGDVMTLIEQARRPSDSEKALKAAEKLGSGGDFTLDDFLEQMQQVRKLGSLSSILGMLPAWARCASSSPTSTSAPSTASRPSSSR